MTSASPALEPLSIGGSSLIHLLDPRETQVREGVETALGRPRKSSLGPLLVEDRPWELAGDNGYPNVLFDPVERIYKLWYSGVTRVGDEFAATTCYAWSPDGLSWVKPALGLWEYNGHRENNIVLPYVNGTGVALDERALNFDERFKMVFVVLPALAPRWADQLMASGFPHSLKERGVGVAFSGDGVHWRLPRENPVLRGVAGDTHNNWVWNHEAQKYALITRRNRERHDGYRFPSHVFTDGRREVRLTSTERIVKRWESDDFLHWEKGTDVFEPEGHDIGRRQYYSMPTFRHGKGYLGLLSLFNCGPSDDTIDLELAWSPDTSTWQRVCPGQAFIPRDAPGSVDGGCIFAGWKPLDVNGVTRLYYSGSREEHSVGPQRKSSLLLATLDRDRYAGLRAWGDGRIVTRPLRCTGPSLHLNFEAQTHAGEIKVELREAGGASVAGFELSRSLPLTGDHTDAVAEWREDSSLSPWVGRDLCVCLTMRHATVFTIGFGPG